MAVLAGTMALVGWVLHDESLATLGLRLGSMQPNCAAAFVLAGLALGLSSLSGAISTRVASACALLVVVAGLATLGESLLGGSSWGREMLFRAGPTFLPSSAVDAERLAPVTALAFSALGLALLAMARGHPRLAQALILPLGFATGVAVVGYAYRVEVLYAYPGQGTTSLPTALAFVVLSIGTLALRPDAGLLKPLASDTPAGVGARRLLPAAILAPVLIGWARLQGERAGLYPAELGLPLVVASTIAVISAVVWWTARSAVPVDEERSRLAAIVESSSDAIFSKDLDGTILTWNAGAAGLYGYAATEVIGRHAALLIPPDRPNEFGDLMQKIRAGERVEAHETVRQRKDGTRFQVALTISPVKDASGAVVGAATIARDVSDRHRAEQALLESARFGEQIIRSAREGIAVFDRDLRYIVWNPFLEESTGMPASEVLGRRPLEAFPMAAGTPVVEAITRALDGETTTTPDTLFEIRGRRYWNYSHVSPLRDSAGTIVGVMVMAHDVSARREAEEALRQQGERLLLAVEGAALGTWHWDVATGELIWSDRCYALWGIAPATPIDFDWFRTTLHPDDRERFDAAVRGALAGSAYDLELRIHWPDGSEHWIAVRGQAYHDAEGRPTRMEGVAREITEQKRLEEQLRQAQKMDAVGRLAGGVAHDFNNLLGVILGYGELLLRRMPADDASRPKVEEILKAGERAAGLTRQLLAFSRKQVLQPKVLDLAAVVTETSRMLVRLIGEDIKLVTATKEGLGRVKADPGQLEQILMNLAVNARDAMPGGGSLTIETSLADLDEAYASLNGIPAGRYCLLSVSDTGSGMTRQTLSHIFEPFFSTKAEGRGTGLGLATVYGIVKQSGGHISVESEPDHGTTFRIFLPSVTEIAAAGADAAGDGVLPRGSETILLVEDSDALRAVAREILEGLGYDVIEAAAAAAALEKARSHAGPLHLLLTDVVMPGLSGRELWERLAAVRAETRVLFMSGYTDDAIVHHRVLESGTPFLPKPFSSAGLARKVRAVLDGPAASI